MKNNFKIYFKGDVIVKEEDALMHWAVTSGQLFHVISTISVDHHVLVHRPFKNYFKSFLMVMLGY